jgi:2-polyprenyl-6-methoxyphenol hydroxylase-like FAD-dependent oxidoreductase
LLGGGSAPPRRGAAAAIVRRAAAPTAAPDPATLATGYDLVIAADGANSATRAEFADAFRPEVEQRQCKYIWLSTDLVFDAFKFYIVQTRTASQVHGYPYDATAAPLSSDADDVWRRAGSAGWRRPACRPPVGRRVHARDV